MAAANVDMKRREEVLQLLVAHRADIFAGILACVRDFAVAEDVFQDVALVVTEQWDDFEAHTNFLAWARQIARNKILVLQRESRQKIFSFSHEAMENIEAAERHGLSPPSLNALRDCLSKLGPKAGALIAMRYGDDCDCARIAKELKTTLANVYMMLSRIRVRLGACVNAKSAQEKT